MKMEREGERNREKERKLFRVLNLRLLLIKKYIYIL